MGALDNIPRDWVTGETVTAAQMNAEIRDKFVDLSSRFVTDSGWVNVTVAGGFAAMTSPEQPQVRLIGKVVYLRGGWTNTGVAAINTTYTVGTIPPGFRPPVNMVGAGGSATGAGIPVIFILPAGDVQVRTGPVLGTYYKMDRQSYLID